MNLKRFMLTYQPIGDFLKTGGKFDDGQCHVTYAKDGTPNLDALHPVLKQFADECYEKFGHVPYLGGARDLRVASVHGRVRIEEYDGAESIEEEGQFSEWL